MFNKIKIFGDKPSGNCLFVSCDLIYFQKFYSKIADSFIRNLSGFDSFHCHVICPEKKINELKPNNANVNCTISYEIAEDAIEVLNNINFEKHHWLNIKDISIREMLLSESYRSSRVKSFLFGHLKKFPLISKKLSPVSYVNKTKLKTYYSLRRFLMSELFFSNITGLLVTDIDSHFQSSLDFKELDSGLSLAISRDDMWSKYMAGFVFFKFESTGRSSSLFTLNKTIANLINNQGLHWGIDQIALDILGDLNLLSSINSFKFSFSNEYDNDALFVSLKGPAKWKN